MSKEACNPVVVSSLYDKPLGQAEQGTHLDSAKQGARSIRYRWDMKGCDVIQEVGMGQDVI